MPQPLGDYAKAQFKGHIAGTIIIVTAAVTPKGERRRHALIRAAAELLSEGGFDAVRHRAVARRADLPLASTTYYFASLDELLIEAVEFTGAQETTRLRSRLLRLSRRRRGVDATADVVVDLLLGDCPTEEISEELVSRYERYIACARHPWLREAQRRIGEQRTAAVVEAVERCGRTVRPDRIKALMCAVDGAVVAALVDDGARVRATATGALADVIDVLAPVK